MTTAFTAGLARIGSREMKETIYLRDKMTKIPSMVAREMTPSMVARATISSTAKTETIHSLEAMDQIDYTAMEETIRLKEGQAKIYFLQAEAMM